MVAVGPCVFAGELEASSKQRIAFDISSQPLADALVAYGAATGLEVYYDGGLALGRRSSPVVGSFTPMQGLETLLEGTGYWPRATGADSFTLVLVAQADLPGRLNYSRIHQHEQYFAALQDGIAKALCEVDTNFDKQLIFSFWIAGTGAVYRTEILGTDDNGSGERMAIVDRINGVNIGRPPPADVPQPVTMVVYPPGSEDAAGCSPSAKPRAGR
jgi:hypothetical protein